jgi:hypothetical protein
VHQSSKCSALHLEERLMLTIESVPTSISSFSHRRARAGSTTSFIYFPDEPEEVHSPSDEDAILDDDDVRSDADTSVDLEAGELPLLRRASSSYSRASVRDRLLRSNSIRTEGSRYGQGCRINQKIYILTEDLTIVIAGFRTSVVGLAVYGTVCILTFGLAYLLFRWLPRLKVRLIGAPTPLEECHWVVIEVCMNNHILSLYAVYALMLLESMGRACFAGRTMHRIWPLVINRVFAWRKEICGFH